MPARHFTSIRDSDVGKAGESEVLHTKKGTTSRTTYSKLQVPPPLARLAIAQSSSLDDERSSPLVAEKPAGTDVEAVINRNKTSMGAYASTFLTQFQVLCGREWKLLRRYAIFFSYQSILWRVYGLGTSHCSLLI